MRSFVADGEVQEAAMGPGAGRRAGTLRWRRGHFEGRRDICDWTGRVCHFVQTGGALAKRARGGPERLAATYARPGEATAWAVPKSKPANRGRSELTTDKTGFRRIGTEALER